MENLAPALSARIILWSTQARAGFLACRSLFIGAALDAKVGALEESLKWRQPAWRPVRPRTGSTLRADWNDRAPDMLSLYVDCKTDLAARMRVIYPDFPLNDGQRHLAIDLNARLPEQALSHLAEMTFTYHCAERGAKTGHNAP